MGAESAGEELLSWENRGAHPPGRAFRSSLRELLLSPGGFFRKMALTGGLLEPLTFFLVVLCAVIFAAFPAALAAFGATTPGPGALVAEEYTRRLLPLQAAGLALALFPFVLAAVAGAMVFLGTLFHLGGKLFGSRNWEGSVSIWLYSAAGALVPLVAALALTFAVSLAAYAVGHLSPAALEVGAAVARWTARLAPGVALLVGVGLFVVLAAFGCVNAFRLEPTLGAAAALAGTLFALAVTAGCAWATLGAGYAGGLSAVAASLAAAGLLGAAGLAVSTSRREGG